MFLLSIAIALFGAGVFTTVIGGQLSDLTDLPSLIFIFFALLAVLTATQSFKVFYSGLRAMIFPKEDISEEARGRAASLFRLLSKTTAIAAAISVLISIVTCVFSLDFSNPSSIHMLGANITASLIPLLYGLLLIIAVFEPVVFNLKMKYADRRSSLNKRNN